MFLEDRRDQRKKKVSFHKWIQVSCNSHKDKAINLLDVRIQIIGPLSSDIGTIVESQVV